MTIRALNAYCCGLYWAFIVNMWQPFISFSSGDNTVAIKNLSTLIALQIDARKVSTLVINYRLSYQNYLQFRIHLLEHHAPKG